MSDHPVPAALRSESPWVPAFAGTTVEVSLRRGPTRPWCFARALSDLLRVPTKGRIVSANGPTTRHSRESGNPGTLGLACERPWIPAFAGMTGVD
ncbi:hypothetical protein EYC45_02975 [Pseudoxanthomonas winnipegensis]|nr:hypothetical protein EYC45_02975 [Pseudoxanthomonas winnipegensis]